jgi:GT2 family glycosyltransferase
MRLKRHCSRATGSMHLKFRFVCATRLTQEEFLATSPLGRSLSRFNYGGMVELRLFPSNSVGLPVLYNIALREALRDPAILMFVHDDIYLCDFFWPTHVLDGLARFDVIGVAGNRRRINNQPGWAFLDAEFTRDEHHNLSGIVGHGTGFPNSTLTFFGAPNQEVKLLDGVLLITRSDTLRSNGIEFDERFCFHFYDMDMCRQIEQRKLRMGTCSISVIHESDGAFGTPAWQREYSRYLEKWGS